MPTPTVSDLHVNQPLTNVSISWKQDNSQFIADKVFPRVPVSKQSDLYAKFTKMDWRKTEAAKRAPGTESKGTGWTFSYDKYFCEVYAVHSDVDDQSKANADSLFQLDRTAAEMVTNQLLLKRELDWSNQFFKDGVWGVDLDADNDDFVKWSDAGSDPIKDMERWKLDFIKRTGKVPNVAVFGGEVSAALRQHPDFIDRIKYTQKGVVTDDLVASLLGVPKVYTNFATVATGADYNDAVLNDTNATFDWIVNSKAMLLAHTTSSPAPKTPTAGYTFTWKGYLGGNSQGLRIKKFRMENIASDRVEGEMTYDMKVVCPELGIFAQNVVDGWDLEAA